MEVQELALPGLKLLRPKVFRDERGFFLESYSDARAREAGIVCGFVQDNHSKSTRGTIRGLHLQAGPGQAKLVRCVQGSIYDVAVDVRPDSPTYKQWVGVTLDADKHEQLFIPTGFAHGFCVTSETAEVFYKVSTPYDPKTETGFRYDDATIGVTWPNVTPLLSKRDLEAPTFLSWLETMRTA
jgi:dTDP-4-dehydrorhamnose 3,5-epimerase